MGTGGGRERGGIEISSGKATKAFDKTNNKLYIIIMKAREIIKELMNAGFVEVRQKGSHRRFEDAYGHKATVPDHGGKDLKPETVNSIRKQAGLK